MALFGENTVPWPGGQWLVKGMDDPEERTLSLEDGSRTPASGSGLPDTEAAADV